MGFRVPYLYVNTNGNTAAAILDLNGPKYLILVIDDFNQNHVNNSLVSISQFNNTLKMPNYYSPDLPYTCVSPEQQFNVLEQQDGSLNQIIGQITAQTLFDYQTPNVQNGLLIASKYEQDYTSTQQVLPSAPRTLTNAQLYTINQIKRTTLNKKAGGTWVKTEVKLKETGDQIFELNFGKYIKDNLKEGQILNGHLSERTWNGQNGVVITKVFNAIDAEYVYHSWQTLMEQHLYYFCH
jgi:hypothetical protein